MVTFHPEDAHSEHLSEQSIISALRAVDGHDEIHVLHSVEIHHSKSRLQGEADFLVLIPGKGMIVIEAKAPDGVELKDRRLHLKGVPDESKDAFKQVDDTRQEILSFLGKRQGLFPTARAVWLTSIDAAVLKKFHGGIGILPFELRSKNDLQNPIATLYEIIDGYNFEHDHKEIHSAPASFTAEEVSRAIDFIQNDFTANARKEDLEEIRDDELVRLEEEQLADLESFRRNKHIYIYGAAGTGKSFMLGEIARQAEEQGQRVLLTCWNTMMAAEMYDQWQEPYPNMTIVDLGALMAEVAGVDSNAGSGNDWYFSELPKLAIAQLEVDPDGYDFDLIAVDEFQDIAAQPIILEFLEKLGKGQSWDKTRVVLAGDKYQQILGDGHFEDNPIGLVQKYIPDLSPYKCTKNFRNAKGIAKALERLTSDQVKYSKVWVTSTPGVVDIVEADYKTAPRRLREIIHQHQNSFDNHDIRVLSPARSAQSMPNMILQLPDDPLRPEIADLKSLLKDADTKTGVIPWRSIYRYKGLESDVVIITDATKERWEELEAENKSLLNMLYVGVSRAHHKVTILCDHFVAEKLRALGL